MSAPGNKPGRPCARQASGTAGFTLLELLLVVAIIAMASGGVAFSLRNLGQTQLEREAQRLIAMLESARARSRASGLPVYWRATGQGFEFIGLPAPDPDTAAAAGTGTSHDFSTRLDWLEAGLTVRSEPFVTLGPEPIIPRQEIELLQGGSQIRIATDGLRAFAVQPAHAGGAIP